MRLKAFTGRFIPICRPRELVVEHFVPATNLAPATHSERIYARKLLIFWLESPSN